ncbi:hypothetical protein ACFQ2B_00100 [Streptomyces stramineus]
MPLGAGIEADALGAAGAEQVHHRQSHRRVGGQAAGEGGEAGGAVVRVEAVVVDGGRAAVGRRDVGGVTDEAFVPGGGHDVQLLGEVHAHVLGRCRGPGGGRGGVDEDAVAGGEAGGEGQQHRPAEAAVVHGRIELQVAVIGEGERQVVAVPRDPCIRPGFEEGGPDRGGGLDLVGHYHLRLNPADEGHEGVEAGVEASPVLRGRRDGGREAHPGIPAGAGAATVTSTPASASAG